MADDSNVGKCPKCSQQTFVQTEKKYAIEKLCDNCGYFTYKFHECCQDPQPEKVLYENRNDSWAIRYQCYSCGGKIGVIPVGKLNDYPNAPFFSRVRESKRLEEVTEIKRHYDELTETNRWRLTYSYLEYLKSDRWAKLRLKILNRDGFKCKCGEVATQVHHLTYDRRENELDEDLISICRPCHLKEHGL